MNNLVQEELLAQLADLRKRVARLETQEPGVGSFVPLTDDGNTGVVSDPDYTDPYSGFTAQNNVALIVRQPTATASTSPFAVILLSNNQTDTTDGNVGSLMMMNEAESGTNKRVAQILAQTDGALNSGKMLLRTFLAGVVQTNLTLEADLSADFSGAVLISQSSLTESALKVLRNLSSTNTDSPLVNLVQDHASDDQPALKIQQDATGTNVSALDIICANATYVLLRASGVAHGMTSVVPTDVFCRVSATSTTDGGATFRGFSDVDAIAAIINGTSGSTAPTIAPVMLLGQKNSGSGGATTLANTEPLLAIATTSTAPLITVYGNGDIDALKVIAGTASDNAKVGGVLIMSTTQTGNVGTGEDVLIDYSLAGNALAVNGQSIEVFACGTFANNANTKRLRFRFGTSGTNLVLDTTALAGGNAAYWELRANVVRTGGATQKGVCRISVSDPALLAPLADQIGYSGALNQTLSSAVTVRISGEATSNNDITIEMCRITWHGENS